MYDYFIAPFAQFGFMQRALAGAVILSISAGPIGLAILPMTIGGFAAGLVVALLAGLVSRLTLQREDTSLAAFYLISLALGVLLVSLRGSNVDLMHVLFGTVLALNDDALLLIGAVSSVSLVGLALIWRPLFAECLDPTFLRSVSKAGQSVHLIFLALVVLNLVGGFQALGTLMSVGLMMLPAAAARFWVRSIEAVSGLAVAIGIVSSYFGLLLSYHLEVASGPSIILVAGAAYIASLILGRRGVLFSRTQPARHRIA